ncbi:MAG: hypothetical protein ABSB74_19385 [Tepidisphaeraceae bacterium]
MSQDKRDKPMRYNARMIRDFLEHLEWEIRVSHFETANAENGLNPELAEMLRKYGQRYHTCLRSCRLLDRDPSCSEEQFRRAFATLRARENPKLTKALEAMEVLKPFFEEAFFCISMKGNLPVIHTSTSEVLRTEDGLGDDDAGDSTNQDSPG